MSDRIRSADFPPALRRAAVTALGALLLASGCAGLTAEQAQDREYRRVAYKHEFLAYRERCRASGGRIVVQASTRVGSDMVPRPGDRYTCL